MLIANFINWRVKEAESRFSDTLPRCHGFEALLAGQISDSTHRFQDVGQ